MLAGAIYVVESEMRIINGTAIFANNSAGDGGGEEKRKISIVRNVGNVITCDYLNSAELRLTRSLH